MTRGFKEAQSYAMQPENTMRTPEDLKHYRAKDYDSFQLMPAECAGWLLLAAVVLACILEPLFRAGLIAL